MEKIIELQRCDYDQWNMLRLKLAFNAGLRIIILNSMGTDPFPVKFAKRICLIVKSLPDYCSDELSDHAFKLLGSLSTLVGFDLKLKDKILVVGSQGNVGQKVFDKCWINGFKALKHDPVLNHTEKDLETNVSKVSVIFVCVPLNQKTFGMFNSKLFSKMKKNKPLIINVSGRMKLFSKMDLLSALKQNWISGYACDDDIYDRRFYMHDKMFFTPHIGWKSPKSERKRVKLLEKLWLEAKQEIF